MGVHSCTHSTRPRSTRPLLAPLTRVYMHTRSMRPPAVIVDERVHGAVVQLDRALWHARVLGRLRLEVAPRDRDLLVRRVPTQADDLCVHMCVCVRVCVCACTLRRMTCVRVCMHVCVRVCVLQHISRIGLS